MKQLNEWFDGICGRYLKILEKQEELKEAFHVFCVKKHQLADLCTPNDRDEDGGEPAGDAPRQYPTEEDKARMRETIAGVSDCDLAKMIRNTKPDLGALNDERRMVFIASTVLDEAASRLENRRAR